MKQRRVIETVWERARTAYIQPHPGATLLEQHRKEVEVAHADGRRYALLQALDRLGMDSAAMYGDPEATDTRLADELWGHVRWLELRARNEGLEKAAVALLEVRDRIGSPYTKQGTRRGGLEEAARIVRALTEPEECTDASCASCKAGEPCH